MHFLYSQIEHMGFILVNFFVFFLDSFPNNTSNLQFTYLCFIIQYQPSKRMNKTNLRQRIQNNNKNNSTMMKSQYDFGQMSKQDQIYDKSRRQCEQQMVKRKSELEYQRANLLKVKEKELNNSLQKFNNDFQDLRKQIVNMINQHLSETKARMMAQIKEKKSVDTSEEIYIKKQIQEMLARINANLIGLKQSQYRQYIAKIVITDFDTSKDEIKQAIRRIKYPLPNTFVDEKTYNCFRADLSRMINLSFNAKPEYVQVPPKDNGVEQFNVNLHQNRDKIKRGG